ncbi:outer membrane protein [Kushneria pakistanensis]|uniref:Outer membrane protein n=1 Tax=Kushneria pakistanensis TaxID=1508770 RepID=A0ABQ3FML2_9GAMM|nr:TolC family protein [Kushneria pakistanensis]GHC29958.1 outer membrane protein [Kushneria pakistanensis]
MPSSTYSRSGCLCALLLGAVWLPSTLIAAPAVADPAPVPLTMAGEARGETGQVVVPSLPALYAHAREYDAELQRQSLEAEASGLETSRARAGLLPTVDLTYSYGYTDSDNYYSRGADSCEENPRTGELFGGDDFAARCRGHSTDSTAQLQLTQPLFSMERWRTLAQSREQVQAAQLQLAIAEQQLALETADAYMAGFYSAQQHRLLEGKQRALELQVKQATRAYELGIGDRIDLLAARSRLDQAHAEIALAGNEYADAQARLARLTGESPDFTRFSLLELAQAQWPEPAALAGFEDGIDDNVQVRLADQQLRVAQAVQAVRQGSYYPEVSLNLSWSDRNSDDPYRESEDRSAVIQARMNLYRGGATSAEVRQADLRRQAQSADVHQQKRLALEELRRRHRGIQGNLSRLEALSQAIRSSELYLEAADRGAALGLRDLVDVLDARATLYDQRIQYVDAFRQLLLDRLYLQAAAGRLGTQDMTDTMALIGQIIGPPRDDVLSESHAPS